jgi:protein tyrosine phosphatase
MFMCISVHSALCGVTLDIATYLLEFTVYNDKLVLGFLEELHSVRQHTQQDSTGPPWPVIVHCLAGAGRTGLLIMADVVKAELENNQVIFISRSEVT